MREGTDTEVEFSNIANAYESDDGQTVVLTKGDLATLPVTRSPEISILEFVPADQVDPIYFDKPYYLEPSSKSPKAYVLLAKALESTDRLAIANFTLRNRTRLAALRVVDGVMTLQTLLWPDEVRKPDSGSSTPASRCATRNLRWRSRSSRRWPMTSTPMTTRHLHRRARQAHRVEGRRITGLRRRRAGGADRRRRGGRRSARRIARFGEGPTGGELPAAKAPVKQAAAKKAPAKKAPLRKRRPRRPPPRRPPVEPRGAARRYDNGWVVTTD